MMPLLMVLVLNAINFGYFFLVALNLAAAPRSGVEYSVMGSQTSLSLALPSATAISNITIADMTGAIFSPSATPVQVCSKEQGVNSPGTTTQTAKCSAPVNSYSSAPSPASDPESPSFVLQRVDVKYTFTPLIPGSVFNLSTLPLSICTAGGSCTFHRQVSMRVMD